MNRSMPQQVTLRDHAGITRLFDGLELVESGVVKASHWRPDTDAERSTPHGALGRRSPQAAGDLVKWPCL